MDPKPRPNHLQYLRILAGMSGEERLLKAFELSDYARSLFKQGLRQRFPQLSADDFNKLYLQRIDLCHNRNY